MREIWITIELINLQNIDYGDLSYIIINQHIVFTMVIGTSLLIYTFLYYG